VRKIFITATDTDAGKTYVACALIKALTNAGYRVGAYKPVSAGCELIDGKLINEDAQRLTNYANSEQSIEQVNPIAFKEPIAPHIAADLTNTCIDLPTIEHHFQASLSFGADIIVTEGAGGWRLPLGNGSFLSEFAQTTQQDVLLVVNMKLGCLNHAMLTYQAILHDGLNCIGWVANSISDMDFQQQNVDELKQLINAPLIAELKNEPDITKAAQALNLQLLNLS